MFIIGYQKEPPLTWSNGIYPIALFHEPISSSRMSLQLPPSLPPCCKPCTIWWNVCRKHTYSYAPIWWWSNYVKVTYTSSIIIPHLANQMSSLRWRNDYFACMTPWAFYGCKMHQRFLTWMNQLLKLWHPNADMQSIILMFWLGLRSIVRLSKKSLLP